MCLTLGASSRQVELPVLRKASGTLGFYTPEGTLPIQVPVGRHPHETALSAGGRPVYIADNGTMRIEDAGRGRDTVTAVDIEAGKKIGEIALGQFHRP